jgi:hypothetical protein
VIDSRRNSDADLRNVVAVTALGTAHESVGDDKERLVRVYVAKHPGLAGFIGAPRMAICAVKVEDYVIARFSGVTRMQP